MDLSISSLTDRGRVREQNEDALLDDAMPLVAIADGMGGHQAGEVASSMALEVLRAFKEKLEDADDAGQQLRDAFDEANRAVYEHGQSDPALEGMGTTLTAGWISEDTLTIAHVGDSRAYLLRAGKLEQLTEDQNAAQDLVRRGRISAEEAASSPHRHYVLQAIGAETAGKLNVDVTTVALRSGDRLLFASDGLFGMVRDAERIRSALADHPDADEACRILVDEALQAGGEDNISVLIVDVDGGVTTSGAAEPVVIEKPAADTPPPAREAGGRRSPWGIALGAAAAVVIIVAIGAFFLMRDSGPNLVVSSRDGKVVVLDGKVGADDRPAEGTVVRRFHKSVDNFPATTRADLRRGFAVESIEAAKRLVNNLPPLLGPEDTPPPTPSGTPIASAGTTLPPKTGTP